MSWRQILAAQCTSRFHRRMLVIHVQIQVKPDQLASFRAATLENARASRREPGVVRFDVCQQQDDPTRWVLWEIYRNPAAHAAHRETPHYATWRDAVEPMMASTRIGTKLITVDPEEAAW
jgi:autoinducer 2-degrading protein